MQLIWKAFYLTNENEARTYPVSPVIPMLRRVAIVLPLQAANG